MRTLFGMVLHRRISLVAASMVLVTSPSLVVAQRLGRGIVFNDANGNGQRDASERGLPNVVVSNQDAVVATDSSGAFELPAGPATIVFVSVPTDFRSIGPFWRMTDSSSALMFGLQRAAQPRTFTFIHASDTHVSAASVGRMRRFRSLADSTKAAFTLFAGDLIRDAMSAKTPAAPEAEFELFVAEAKQLVAPWWTVPGNHDHYGIIPTHSGASKDDPRYNRGMYRQKLGPDYYSFNFGGVHFVGLNTLATDDSAYYGKVDSVQLAWLARDVEKIPASMPIVTFNHIPLTSAFYTLSGFFDMALVGSVAHDGGAPTHRHTVANTVAVFNAVGNRKLVLALGAHSHAGEKIIFTTTGGTLRFEQSSAIIGAGGELGAITIPSGFTLYTVRAGEIDAGRFVPMDPPASGRKQ